MMRMLKLDIHPTEAVMPALCRASTLFVPRGKPWMAGTSPAMTMPRE
jgi:hypothetical protein